MYIANPSDPNLIRPAVSRLRRGGFNSHHTDARTWRAHVALAYNIGKIVQLQTGACPDPDHANNDQTQYCYKPVAPYRDHRPATALLLGLKQPEKLDRPKHRPPHRYASGART